MRGKTEFLFEVKVKVEGFGKYKGYSDLVETYCCSSTSCYYVVFPATGYEGYFHKWDIELREEKGDSRCTNKSESSL